MRTRLLSLTLVLAAAATTSIGCNDNNNNANSGTVIVGTSSVSPQNDTVVVQTEAGILWSIANTFDPVVAGGALIAPNVAVASIGSGIHTVIGPVGCVSTSRGDDFVTIRFATCSPPFGPPNSTAALGVGVSQNAGSIEIDAQSSTVKATAANVSLDATALYTAAGNGRTLTITSTGTSATAAGNHTARSGTYTVTWTAGDTCANIDGSLTSLVNAGDVLTFGAFRVCTTGCPLSGTVTHVDPVTGVTTTFTYNGTSTASFTNSAGQSGVQVVTCQ